MVGVYSRNGKNRTLRTAGFCFGLLDGYRLTVWGYPNIRTTRGKVMTPHFPVPSENTAGKSPLC